MKESYTTNWPDCLIRGLLAKAEEMESRFIKKLVPLELTARQFGVLQYPEGHPKELERAREKTSKLVNALVKKAYWLK